MFSTILWIIGFFVLAIFILAVVLSIWWLHHVKKAMRAIQKSMDPHPMKRERKEVQVIKSETIESEKDGQPS